MRPALPQEEPIVKVRVLKVRDSSASVRIGANEQFIELLAIDEQSPADPRREPSLPAAVLYGPVEIRAGAGGWSILDAHRFRPTVAGMETLELRPLLGGPDSTIAVNGRAHPGFMRFIRRSEFGDGACDVVNHVAVEEYLPGVLAGELYAHWHPATFAAQAIAARSFACTEHAYFGSRRHYDLTNTSASQVYGGSTSRRRAIEAVDLTHGVVLASAGRLVPGYYSSCCGGVAADAIDAIGEHPYNNAAPLRGRSGLDVCTDAPLFSWSIERPIADLVNRLHAWGKARGDEVLAELDSLSAIEVAQRNAHGRPRTYVIRGADNVEVNLSAETLRRALDYTANNMPPPERPLWSSNISVTISQGAARIDGHGHGHGAGLCQYGAETLARSGRDAESILRWYYPGVEIVTAYGSSSQQQT